MFGMFGSNLSQLGGLNPQLQSAMGDLQRQIRGLQQPGGPTQGGMFKDAALPAPAMAQAPMMQHPMQAFDPKSTGEQRPSQYYGMSRGYQTYSANPQSGLMGNASRLQPMQPQQQMQNTASLLGNSRQQQRPTGLMGAY